MHHWLLRSNSSGRVSEQRAMFTLKLLLAHHVGMGRRTAAVSLVVGGLSGPPQYRATAVMDCDVEN
jgi:hypothetical protein